MSLFVECKPDETLALALGVSRHDLEHAGNRAGVCAQVSRRSGTTGMVDEDPGAATPHYMKTLAGEPMEHEIRVLCDSQRKNRLVVICPRLEEWLVQSAKSSGLKMTDFGFESDNGLHLHREINHRLESLKKVVSKLIEGKSKRLLYLQSLLVKKQSGV
jgi:hypothetical protein